jgi:hypothetical protein
MEQYSDWAEISNHVARQDVVSIQPWYIVKPRWTLIRRDCFSCSVNLIRYSTDSVLILGRKKIVHARQIVESIYSSTQLILDTYINI